MTRPGALKAQGIYAARWLALSERTQRFVLDGGHGFGMAQRSEAQPGIGAWIHCQGKFTATIGWLGGLRAWAIVFGVGRAHTSLQWRRGHWKFIAAFGVVVRRYVFVVCVIVCGPW